MPGAILFRARLCKYTMDTSRAESIAIERAEAEIPCKLDRRERAYNMNTSNRSMSSVSVVSSVL